MPNVHRTIAAGVALSLIASLAFAQRWPDDRGRNRTRVRERTVHLKSTNYRRSTKNVDNRGVRLVRQKSNVRCIEGRTWGYTRNRIWVDRGCEADFAYIPRR